MECTFRGIIESHCERFEEVTGNWGWKGRPPRTGNSARRGDCGCYLSALYLAGSLLPSRGAWESWTHLKVDLKVKE